ncbi:MAG: transaldolase [Anaerolineales bacterium]|nr:transaldolase [Anaerolineales bacterium]
MNNSQKVYQLGQSIWYDNIQRKLLENGELARMIAEGEIYGVTSNPSIFNNAIANSNDYDADLLPLLADGRSPFEVFEALAVKDIQAACDLFVELYQSTNGGDGYVSLEVDPELAHETEATVVEAKKLWKLVDRPNLMVKIPATLAGIPAVEQAIAAGVNVNVTLIFSLERYQMVMEAYLAGLEQRIAAGLPVDRIASVASFFVSRMDTKVDQLLAEIGTGEAKALMGRSAVANAKLAYQRYLTTFGGERFAKIKAAGGRVQRPLWASTSTKNPAYPETLYVDTLIGADTVNTIPPKTLVAFLNHGVVADTILKKIPEQEKIIEALEALGISVKQVTDELEAEGVAAFARAFADLLAVIESRKE